MQILNRSGLAKKFQSEPAEVIAALNKGIPTAREADRLFALRSFPSCMRRKVVIGPTSSPLQCTHTPIFFPRMPAGFPTRSIRACEPPLIFTTRGLRKGSRIKNPRKCCWRQALTNSPSETHSSYRPERITVGPVPHG